MSPVPTHWIQSEIKSIRQRINAGVTAGIVGGTDQNGQNTYSLVIASSKTGVANAVTIGGTLAGTFDFTNIIKAAHDAEFTIDGNSVKRSENTITDVIDGVTFTLLDQGQSSFTIATDNVDRNKNIVSAMQAMIDSYNKLMDFIDQNTADRILAESSVNLVKKGVQGLFEKTFASIGGVH